MFGAPSHPPATSDARKTYANTAGRPDKPFLTIKHGLTGELGSTVGFREAATSATDKKQHLALVLEDNLVKKFSATGAARDVIKHNVTAAVLGGMRITPETIKELQDKIAQLLMKDSSRYGQRTRIPTGFCTCVSLSSVST